MNSLTGMFIYVLTKAPNVLKIMMFGGCVDEIHTFVHKMYYDVYVMSVNQL